MTAPGQLCSGQEKAPDSTVRVTLSVQKWVSRKCPLTSAAVRLNLPEGPDALQHGESGRCLRPDLTGEESVLTAYKQIYLVLI